MHYFIRLEPVLQHGFLDRHMGDDCPHNDGSRNAPRLVDCCEDRKHNETEDYQNRSEHVILLPANVSGLGTAHLCDVPSTALFCVFHFLGVL